VEWPYNSWSKNTRTFASDKFLHIVKADLLTDIAKIATHNFAKSDFFGNNLLIERSGKIVR
jgi:hypothetical protein